MHPVKSKEKKGRNVWQIVWQIKKGFKVKNSETLI